MVLSTRATRFLISIFGKKKKTGIIFTMLCFAVHRSVKRETLKLIETFLDKAEDQPHIGKQFVPPMMESVLGDYARNVPDARESEVLSLFATIINKYASYWLMLSVVFMDVYHLHISQNCCKNWCGTLLSLKLEWFWFVLQVQGNNVGRRASHIWSCFPVYIGGNQTMFFVISSHSHFYCTVTINEKKLDTFTVVKNVK